MTINDDWEIDMNRRRIHETVSMTVSNLEAGDRVFIMMNDEVVVDTRIEEGNQATFELPEETGNVLVSELDTVIPPDGDFCYCGARKPCQRNCQEEIEKWNTR